MRWAMGDVTVVVIGAATNANYMAKFVSNDGGSNLRQRSAQPRLV
jgi:hypothetical protein